MRKFLLLFAAIAVSAFAGSHVTPAYAQANRTWVSGAGNDSNDCSRPTPCATFTGALGKTNAGGEINCLDSGSFGGVTITKAIAIKCDNVSAGVLVSGTNGITINAGANDAVYLSGLDIEGTGTGISGISFTTGGVLHVQFCTIRGFSAGNAGFGILFQPSGAAKMFVSDTVIADNVGVAIEVKPTGSGSALVQVARVLAKNNITGFRGNGTATTGPISITITDSVSSGNAAAGINGTSGSGQITQVMVDRTASTNNGSFGIRTDGAGATVRFGNSVFSGNKNATATLSAVNGATLSSYSTNVINGNVQDLPYPPTIPLQ